jgi:diguanylate cyclase (GGDEF)-like protein
MLTALEGREDRLKGIAAGADDFISKPFDQDELRTRVNSILRLNRYRRILEQTERVAYLEAYDVLTDLPNRRLLIQKLSQILESRRLSEGCLAMLVVGLEGLVEINNTLGNAVGDRVIKTIAGRLRPLVRNHDIVARLADDKFAIVVTEAEPDYRLNIASLARRIREEIQRPLPIENREIYIHACVGISICLRERKNPDALITNATTAMHYAGELSEEKQLFFSETMSSSAQKQVAMSSDLRKALDKNEICVFYQPKVDLKSGRITSLEALVRWQHAEYGLIAPNDFIEAAEESGLIVPLGERVLHLVCSHAKKWQLSGMDPVKFTVNISAVHFRRANFVDSVYNILSENELESTHLGLEFTEDLLMPRNSEDEQSILDTLMALKNIGVSMAIDNFGTGYSSLNHITHLPIDALKIDRSFIINMFRSINDATVTKAIIDLAHNLKLKAVAMGVETLEHRDFLKGWDCDEAQGHMFSRPVPLSVLKQQWQEHGGVFNFKEEEEEAIIHQEMAFEFQQLD